MTDYHINVFYNDEDRGYIADVPDLEACAAFGASAEDALVGGRAREGSLAGRRPRSRSSASGTSLPSGDHVR